MFQGDDFVSVSTDYTQMIPTEDSDGMFTVNVDLQVSVRNISVLMYTHVSVLFHKF